MLEWLKIIGNIFLLLLGFKKKKEERKERMKKEAEDVLDKGIEEKDASDITTGFDRINRM